jgi:predicted Rdx family selenoprotein
LAARILGEYAHDVGAIELVSGAPGVVDVQGDGELVLTKSMLGRYPDPNDVLPMLHTFLQAEDH